MTVAVLDACVLYPPTLRDFLMWLAAGFVYSPRLTDAIHEEWIENVLLNNSETTRVKLERTRALMNGIRPDALVTGYEHRIPRLNLPDPDDRHALAAAIEASASVIVTFNIRDFPAAVLSTYGISARHPDVFAARLFDQQPKEVIEMARRNRRNLKNPPKSPEEYLASLRRCGLKTTAARLEPFADQI